jgi:hypothetical protein
VLAEFKSHCCQKEKKSQEEKEEKKEARSHGIPSRV